MATTTTDPPPESSLLEQFGAWLDAFPAVPPWVQWIVVVVGIGVPVMSFLWINWGANRWAARSRDSAVKQGKKIGHNVFRAHSLCRNRPAMLIRLTVFLAGCVAVSMLAIIGLISVQHLHVASIEGLPASDDTIIARTVRAVIFWFGSYVAGVVLFLWFDRTLAPLFDIDRYTRKSRKKIERMVIKSGAPQETMTKVLETFDDLVGTIQKRDIK